MTVLNDFLVQRVQEPAWRLEALCQGDRRFLPAGRPSNAAKKTCARCPVREECLETALESPWEPDAGIWAGLVGDELVKQWRARHGRGEH